MAEVLYSADISLDEILEEDDPDECAHIVKRAGDIGATKLVAYAVKYGMELTALCGYKWIPKHNPENFPLCKQCVKLWESGSY